MNADFWARMAIGILVITGIWNAFNRGMIFERLGDFLCSFLPKYALKPLFECPMCMASVHGTWIWFTTGGDLWMWPIYVIALSGAMKLITIEFLNRHV